MIGAGLVDQQRSERSPAMKVAKGGEEVEVGGAIVAPLLVTDPCFAIVLGQESLVSSTLLVTQELEEIEAFLSWPQDKVSISS
jgi:hypothetical protein